ncbi:response regulator [Myxococcota bacterium]|nr:response regulator [Myxococcota bacterium]
MSDIKTDPKKISSWISKISLKYQILAVVSILVAGAVTANSLMTIRLMREDKRAYVYELTSSLAANKADQITVSLNSIEERARFLVSLPEKSQGDYAQKLFAADPSLLWTGLLQVGKAEDSLGDSLGESLKTNHLNQQVLETLGLDREILQQSFDDVPPLQSLLEIDGSQIMNVSQPPDIAILLLTARLSESEVVFVFIHAENLMRVFARTGIFSSFLTNSRGDILLHSDATPVIQRQRKLPPSIHAAFQRRVRSGVNEFIQDGEHFLGAHTLLDGGRCAVVVKAPREKALASIRNLTLQSIHFALLAIFATLIVSILFARNLFRPLHDLEVGVEELSKGNLGVQIQSQGNRELKSVGDAFNHMSSALADRDRRYTTLVGTLAAGVAHEINNPLTYIQNNIEFALKVLSPASTNGAEEFSQKEKEEAWEALKSAFLGSRRVADIVEDLSNFAGDRVTETEVLELDEVVDATLKLASAQFRYKGTIDRKRDGAGFVQANRSRLGQILLNLLLNAVDAQKVKSSELGTIVVHTFKNDNGFAIVKIADNGSGIAAEIIDRIFDPFFTTKKGTGGGLGLSITRSLVREMEGDLSLESVEGEGTTITISLPTAVPSIQELVVVPEIIREKVLKMETLNILIIDDDPLVSDILERIVGKSHNTQVVGDPQEALSLLEEKKQDIIFCDVMMPQMTGPELLEEARSRSLTNVDNFIFVTGGAFSADTELYLHTTSNQVLRKPFRRADVLNAIETLRKNNLQS